MASTGSLPKPAEWPSNVAGRGKYLLSVLMMVALSVGSVLAAVGFVAIGEPGGLKYGLAFALFFALIAGFGYVSHLHPANRESDISIARHAGHPVMELRYAGAPFYLLVGLVLCVLSVCVMAAVDFATADGSVVAGKVAAALVAAAALFFGSFIVLVGTGRLSRGRILLSQEGILQRGHAFMSSFAWDVLAGVKAAHNGTPEVLVVAYSNAPWHRGQLSRLWKLDKLPPVPLIEIDCSKFDIDPNLVFHLVKFYVENPSARAELGTDACLQRMRTRAFG